MPRYQRGMTSISGIPGTGSSAASASAQRKSGAAFEQILDAFRKAAFQTPEERAREAVLKKHDMTEEDYAKLPPREREAIDREVVEAVKKIHERKTGVPIGQPDFPRDTKLFG